MLASCVQEAQDNLQALAETLEETKKESQQNLEVPPPFFLDRVLASV